MYSDSDSGDSPLSPDGRLRLWKDPVLWIRKNPTRLLSVRRLELNYFRLRGQGIGDSIGQLTELTHLSIEYVRSITCLPNILTTLPNLQMLELFHCDKLQELPPNLGDLKSLTSLSLSFCDSLKSLPDSLVKLSKLTKLDIKCCRYLEKLPANFGELESLMQFALTCVRSIKFLPDSFSKLLKLTKLNISFCNNLEELPANFGELESLTHFTLGCSSIKSLPSSVAKLSKLTTFKIYFCDDFQELPANLGELKSLTHLCINEYISLKDRPSNLNVISIQSLPRGLSNLTQLHLPICITEEERLANLKYFVSLRYLKFGDCFLHNPKELPANLDNPPQLSVLDFTDARIKCLPISITKLSKLRLLLLPSRFILETLPHQLDESLVISIDNTHVRKTWKELKKEMEIFSPTVRVDPSGYLHLTGDPTPWIQNNNTSHSMVQILDLELEELEYGSKENITDSIANLTELTHLHITDGILDGILTQLPLQLTRITHLSLNDCEFELDMDSPLDSPGKISSLESLHISSQDTNLLVQMDLPVSLRQLTLCLCRYPAPLPDSMTKLSNLQALHLFGKGGHGIQFDSLPEILNLKKLKLVDCYIKSLPRGLRHVEILYSWVMISYVYDKLENCFNQLVDVETLSVTCYHIESLPSIAGLYNLQELQLKDCFSIKEFPPNLDVMVNLCTLNVSGTRIKSLPCSILNLPKLRDLILPKCFQPGSSPLKFRSQSVMVSIDDTDDNYYKFKNKGYYDFVHETCSEVDNNTKNTIERVNEAVSKESEEGIISQQQISPHQLLNQPGVTSVLGDSHGSEANHPLGENSHHTILQSEQLTADNRLLYLQNPCFPSSQHALQHEQMPSMTSEIEQGLPYFQHDFSKDTGNNLLVSENGQNEDNMHSEDNIFNGRDNNSINEYSHHSIYLSRNQEETIHLGVNSQHDLQNVQMPENMTCINEDVLKDTEERIIVEQQTSFRQSLNLPYTLLASNSSSRNDLIGENSHREHLSSGVCDEMIIGKNGQHAVQDGQMNIRNSETEHAITILNQDISSCNERVVSHSGHNPNAFENDQIENNSENEGKKGKRKRNEITLEEIQSQFGEKQEDAAIALGVKLSPLKRRCRELGIEKWPSSRMLRRHCTNKRKASSEHSQHVVECLDGVNQHVLSNHVPDHVPSGHNVVDNSTLVATQQHRDSDQRVQQQLDGANMNKPSTIVQANECTRTIVVKATYKDDQVKVYFPLSSSAELLKERIGKKLKLDVDKFKMKYQDEDKDLLLVADISDLEDALRVSESSGSNVVRLRIEA